MAVCSIDRHLYKHIGFIIVNQLWIYLIRGEAVEDVQVLIRTVKPPCVGFNWTSQEPIKLFGNVFQRNLRPLKPCAVIIGTMWLKYNIHLIWECAEATPELHWCHWAPTPYTDCIPCHHMARPMQDLTLLLVPAKCVRMSSTPLSAGI